MAGHYFLFCLRLCAHNDLHCTGQLLPGHNRDGENCPTDDKDHYSIADHDGDASRSGPPANRSYFPARVHHDRTAYNDRDGRIKGGIMTFRITSVFIIMVAVALWAAPVYPGQFNLTVPVRLYSLYQGVSRAKVLCEVLTSSKERVGWAEKWSTGNANAAGNLSEDILISFGALPGKNPRDAVSYKCSLYILLGWIQGQPWQQPSQSTSDPYSKAKPGTEFRIVVSGPIPQPPTLTQEQIKAVPLKTVPKSQSEKQGVTKGAPAKPSSR